MARNHNMHGQTMATIHRIEPSASHRPAAPSAAGTAEIILFPGVRYERWREDQDAAQASRQRRRRRDRLEIAD